MTRHQQITPINQKLGAGNSSNKVLLFQGQLTNLLGNNPDLIGSGATLLYSAKVLGLTVSWHIQSGRSLDAFLRPDGLISPQTIDDVKFARLLVFWVAPPKKAPIRFHEILLIKNEGYRFQQADLLQRVRTIPIGEDTRFFASIENTGGGPLTSNDEVVIQGEIEEFVEVVGERENFGAQLSAIEAKVDTLLNRSPATGDTTVIQGSRLEVLDAGECFRFRHVDGNYTWNNVNTFPPQTSAAFGKIRFGYLTLKNKLIVRVAGAFAPASRGDVTRLKLFRKNDDVLLLTKTGTQMYGQDRGNGYPMQAVEIDTATFNGEEVYLDFETDSPGYTGGLSFVSIAHEFITY
ncbi:MAG: hypothetical protein SAJ11_09785 [Jaaginema sp. PMC 1078.18]|nr:hypothetical protein [Jaaginema sp. PMC 1078.18]